VDLVEILRLYIADEALAVVGLIEKDDESVPLNELFKISPESAIIQAYNILEKKLLESVGIDLSTVRYPVLSKYRKEITEVLSEMAHENFIDQESPNKFYLLNKMRNRAAHSSHFQDEVNIVDDWQECLNIANNLISGIDKAAKQNFFANHGIKLKNLILSDESSLRLHSAETTSKGNISTGEIET